MNIRITSSNEIINDTTGQIIGKISGRYIFDKWGSRVATLGTTMVMDRVAGSKLADYNGSIEAGVKIAIEKGYLKSRY